MKHFFLFLDFGEENLRSCCEDLGDFILAAYFIRVKFWKLFTNVFLKGKLTELNSLRGNLRK